MSEEIKFDLDKDIIMQIEMDSYMKYNGTIASMNDHLGEIYDYSDVRDAEEAQLHYEKKLAYKAIVDLQQKVEQLENIRKEAIEFLENKENIIDTYYKHDFRKYPDYDPFNDKDGEDVRCVELYGYNDLLNILNKGSEDNGLQEDS